MANTTNYSWNTPNDTDYVRDGALAIRTLGNSADSTLFTALGGNYPGLRLIKKQNVGTAVSSVVVNDVFSATFNNYKIVYSGGVGSSGLRNIFLSLNGLTTGYDSNTIYNSFGGVTISGQSSSNQAQFRYVGAMTTADVFMDADLKNPFLNKSKFISGPWFNINPGIPVAGTMSGINITTTSCTGFTLTGESSATLTGGTIYVYGYGIS
jgi:hypothetical protein